MVEQIHSENIRKILASKEEIEKAFKIRITNRTNPLIIEGSPEKEIIAVSFFEAVDLGFSIPKALELKFDNFEFRKIKIKSIATRRNLSQVRARVIGKHRKVMDNIEYLTGCDLALHDNEVGIIGPTEAVDVTEEALKNLIGGSKHATIYAFLEKIKKEGLETG
jgi:ribosomal RNA assembly protein